MLVSPVSPHPPPRTLCVEQLPHLLEQTDHVGVLTDSQTQRHGQSLLVLQTAGVELGPELHLQLTILLLRKLKLCHTALQLQEDKQKEDRQEDDRQEDRQEDRRQEDRQKERQEDDRRGTDSRMTDKRTDRRRTGKRTDRRKQRLLPASFTV